MTPPAGAAAVPVALDPARAPEPAAATERKRRGENVALVLVIGIPFLALVAAVPVAWGWGLGWRDVTLAVLMYAVTGHGITVGFHRHFTHGSFRANRGLKVALAVAGSMAIEGPVVRWVADHRRHHAFSDREGDPHSPWRYGETVPALVKGLFYAHMLGGLLSWSWQGAVTAFFWASLVRVALLHHVTWSINSICHAIGDRPFRSRDRSGNVWWLALLSMGESWHNLHHADPTCARHGVLRGQIDSSARVIWFFERLGWATDVRWPRADRLATRRADGGLQE
jgi:stearoyl-CoA desaturase (delta-9 desaturase)